MTWIAQQANIIDTIPVIDKQTNILDGISLDGIKTLFYGEAVLPRTPHSHMGPMSARF